MRREVQYRAALARQEFDQLNRISAQWLRRLPLASMIAMGWIEPHADKGRQVAECLRFFGVASVEAWDNTYNGPLAAFRGSPASSMAGPAAAAWLRQGERLAQSMPTADYSATELRQRLPALRSLTTLAEPEAFVPALTALCAEAGIAVVVLPTPRGCPAFGATKWISPTKALLLLSNRFKTHDVLWFTFFHEICHLLQHSKKLTVLEGADDVDDQLESEADTFAANLLIPPAAAQRLADLPHNAQAIAAFAREIGVAPGIVLGRMQKQGLMAWSRCGELKVRYEFAEV